MKKTFMWMSLALLVIGASLAAQTKLAPSAVAPKIDGVIAAKEYAWVSAGGNVTIALALSKDSQTLYCAMSAPTVGWVSVGLGSLKMNKSFMVIGYDDGTSNVSEIYGFGQKHGPATQKVMIEGGSSLDSC